MAKATKKIQPVAQPATPSYEKEAATEVINLRVPASVKSTLAAEAIRDGRSISQVTLRAIKLGLVQMGL